MRTNGKTVFVGLSGGVDSSLSAQKLINEGYRVVGVFIKTWQPEFITCTWEAERLDAMRVAAHLGIPFLTCDAQDSYKNDVAGYMIREYKAGRTPNPDVMCNRHVKFGTFLNFAKAHGADYVATGHYAKIFYRNGTYELHRGADPEKDQSYFLWTLTQEQRSRILFPIGHMRKVDVRKEAYRYGIPTYNKEDSQGICFLGQVDMKDFLSHYITVDKGAVLNENNECVGMHDGALYYTLGQRHGFVMHHNGPHTAPQYVIAKNLEDNTITVSPKKPQITGTMFQLSDMNLTIEPPCTVEAQFRYRQKPFPITLTTDRVLAVLDPHVEMPSPGQSCVFYRGTECLGGGIIDGVV